MKVYLVHIDIHNSCGEDITSFRCFDTMEKAKQFLKEFEKEFEYDENYVIEYSDLSYVRYLEGHYNSDRYCATIYTEDVE